MSTNRSLVWIGVLAWSLIPIGGCGWVSPPNWYHPGPAIYQQRRAVEFDPYPADDMGPPVVGGRPRDFQRPEPETVRARPKRSWPAW